MCAAEAAGLSVRPACQWHRLMVRLFGSGPQAFLNMARVSILGVVLCDGVACEDAQKGCATLTHGCRPGCQNSVRQNFWPAAGVGANVMCLGAGSLQHFLPGHGMCMFAVSAGVFVLLHSPVLR